MPRMKTKLRKDDVVPVIRLVRTFRGGGFQIPRGEREQDVPTGAITTVTALMTADAVGSSRPEPRAATRGSSAALGPKRKLFGQFCVPCHGEDGRSGPVRSDVPSAPDFMSVDWHRRRSDQQLKISILEGRGSRMPAFHGKLGDDQVGDIVAFLRSLAPARAHRNRWRRQGSNWTASMSDSAAFKCVWMSCGSGITSSTRPLRPNCLRCHPGACIIAAPRRRLGRPPKPRLPRSRYPEPSPRASDSGGTGEVPRR